MIRSRAILKSARGESCTLNVAQVCNGNPETTVFAHFRWLGDCGTSFKPGDIQGAYACSECNRWTDSPTPKERNHSYESDRNFYALRGMVRTLGRLAAKGLIQIQGARI